MTKKEVEKHKANLFGANLFGADLCEADLREADLCGADLRGADLREADLCGADLREADLCGAEVDVKQISHTRILPEGSLVGWKKCNGGILVKLEIPCDSPRSHATGRKCRAKFVKVLAIEGVSEAVTDTYGPETIYRVGELVECDKWDDDWRNECSGGIHFFITREEAVEYGL